MKVLKIIVTSILVIAAAVTSYLFLIDKSLIAEAYLRQGIRLTQEGAYSSAVEKTEQALKLDQDNPDIYLELGELYYTQKDYETAESYLVTGIARKPTVKLYTALSRVYVGQDRLEDAVKLLDGITDPVIKTAISNSRPPLPQLEPLPGYYNERISVSLSEEGYYSADGSFPSIKSPYTEPFELGDGDVVISAVAVNSEGLVSVECTGEYSISGVVEQVVFEDKAVEEMARAALSKGPGDTIMSDELRSVTELSDEAITDRIDTLEDLKQFTGLESLSLSEQTGVELSALPASLKRLSLADCSLDSEDIVALARLTELEYLDLSYNSITDISPLTGCTALKKLDVIETGVENIEVLTELGVEVNK